MIENVRKKLVEFEELVKTRQIPSFKVYIKPDGILISAQDEEQRALMPLNEELLQSLQMFFYDIESIEYGSLDYTNITSIIHAKAILERLLHNPQYQQQ